MEGDVAEGMGYARGESTNCSSHFVYRVSSEGIELTPIPEAVMDGFAIPTHEAIPWKSVRHAAWRASDGEVLVHLDRPWAERPLLRLFTSGIHAASELTSFINDSCSDR